MSGDPVGSVMSGDPVGPVMSGDPVGPVMSGPTNCVSLLLHLCLPIMPSDSLPRPIMFFCVCLSVPLYVHPSVTYLLGLANSRAVYHLTTSDCPHFRCSWSSICVCMRSRRSVVTSHGSSVEARRSLSRCYQDQAPGTVHLATAPTH